MFEGSRQASWVLLLVYDSISFELGIVGFGRPPWQNAGAEHRQRCSHRRDAVEASRVPRADHCSCGQGSAGHPAPRTACLPGTLGFTAFLHGQQRLPHPPKVVHHRSPPVAFALLHSPLQCQPVVACRRGCKCVSSRLGRPRAQGCRLRGVQ